MKLLVCLIVCFLGAALAQFNASTIPAGASPDVTTAFVFPDHPAKGTVTNSPLYKFMSRH
jgi:hypothetical protein